MREHLSQLVAYWPRLASVSKQLTVSTSFFHLHPTPFLFKSLCQLICAPGFMNLFSNLEPRITCENDRTEFHTPSVAKIHSA